MKEEHPGHGPEEEPQDDEIEFSIARSRALIPLLVMFGVSVLAIVISVATAKPVISPVGAVADKAFGPADFPMVFGKDEALVGLGGGGSGSSKLVFPVPAPPFSEGVFPCMQCHSAIPPNPERRPLEAMHADIDFQHDAEHRWCLDCHDRDDRDQLRLANGTLVPFTESYRLCGQCHGTQFRDWRQGIHGKRTGYWNGGKRYLLCVHCHSPHSPRFAAVQPLPPPVRPQFLRREDASAAALYQRPDAPAGEEKNHEEHAG